MFAAWLGVQLRQLDGIEVSVVERVEANNMAGGATDGLMTIRHRYFPKGELEDGGGAVPPTAAGDMGEAHCSTRFGRQFGVLNSYRWRASFRMGPAYLLRRTAQ